MTCEEFDALAALVPYRRKGMFYSEVFAFLQACQRQVVDLILESGVKFGMSTKLLSVAWPGEIISVDKNVVELGADYLGVQFLQGDSRVLIPRLLRQADGDPPRRVGVLIDGPKGTDALKLKDACLLAPACRVVGVHDVPYGSGESSHTYEPAKALIRELLDRRISESWRRKYPMGPGLGIWEKP